MFRLSHLLIVALATIGIFTAPTPAEAFPFPHVTAVVNGTVDTDIGGSCQITGWTDPVTHQPNAQFPDRPGNHMAFRNVSFNGKFHLTTSSFTGSVRVLGTLLACVTRVVSDNPQLKYGLILPASFSSPAAGLLVLQPGGDPVCVYGTIERGSFLIKGGAITALLKIKFDITHLAGGTLGSPCPASNHNGPHRLSLSVEVGVIPCSSLPDPKCVVEDDDVIAGVATSSPVS